jgi:signal transduction histidine kinase
MASGEADRLQSVDDVPRGGSAGSAARTAMALVSTARHELRTPLNAIIGYGEMLVEEAADGFPDLQSEVELIVGAGRGALATINDALDASRVERWTRSGDLRPVLTRVQADLAGPVGSILDRGERLRVEAERRSLDSVVRDLEAVLSAARRLLQAIGDFESLEATAEVVARDAEGRTVSRASSVSRDESEGTLLVVDDVGTNRDVLERRLRGQGYDVVLAENGRVALERLAERPIDLVLLDLMMPELDGFETLRRIKGDPRLRHVPVVMISASDDIDGVARSIELGAEDYLSKPFNAVLLRARVEASLEKKRLRDQEVEQFEQIARAREEAIAANRAKSDFLANMSHELRTPLNAILGFTQLLDRDATLQPVHRESLAIVRRAGEHLLGLINDVLSISKIEAGRVTLAETEFELRELLEAVEGLFHLRAREKDLRLDVMKSADLPVRVRGDEGKLRQVLVNLLANAVKFTHSGAVTVRAAWSAGLLTVEVEDTGVGISAAELATLFEPFVQTASGRSSGEGTGLGLSISRNFVRHMGGDLTARSEVGVGTVFRVTVPLEEVATDQPAGASRRVARLATGEPSYRVLVTDERAENRQPLVRLLTLTGFEVREASSGDEAIGHWEAWRPHMIWLETRLSGIDGFEVTRRIRSRESTADARCTIVALTASAFEHDRARILDEGFDDFVAKPYREATIFEKLERHLGARFELEAETDVDSSAESLLPGDPAPARVASLPSELVRELVFAVQLGDVESAHEVADRMRTIDGTLAAEVSRLVRAYRFDEVLDLVGEGQAGAGGA